MRRRTNGERLQNERLLLATLERLKAFEQDSIERLTRVEEGLRLLRQDLIGNGQPGRILRLESDLDVIRTEHARQRGLLAGISFVISTVAGLLARYLNF